MVMRLVLAALLSVGLAACGGGGGADTPATPPAAPTGVTALARDQYVVLDATVDPAATAVNVYWKVGTGVTKANGAKLVVTSAPQWHTGLSNGTEYCYVVTAVAGGAESADSAEYCATPVAATGSVADPFFVDQWHLLSTGSQAGASGVAATGEDVRAQGAWGAGYKGQGVRIAIVDDGIEAGHEDLAGNMGANGLSHNYITGTSDPTNDPADTTSGHGTSCAGIAAARENYLGGKGVAPLATLVGYNATLSMTASNEADAMTRNASGVSISSNSWGAPDGTGELAPSSSTWKSAINTGLTTGRGGKGTLYMWAAGNGRDGSSDCPTCFDDSNYDGQANYRGVMAVAAVNDKGQQSSYSESGANVWISAPGGEYCSSHTITTVDRTGSRGHNPPTNGYVDYTDQNYTRCMNGTSSATPGAAGVAALVLSAKPTLGWRDVRIILASSARKNDAADAEWLTNGGGYHFNRKYGFGVVDANAAVAAALAYGANVGTELTYTTATSTVNAPIADTATTGTWGTATVRTMNVTTSPTIGSIEWVEATVTITAGAGAVANSYYSGDFGIQLTSPSNKFVYLAVPHLCDADQFGACTTTFSGWVFGDAAHLGEAANGTWTLTVADAIKGGATGTLVSWKLKFYGH